MRGLFSNRDDVYRLLTLVILGGMFVYMFIAFTTQIPSADEMIFLRVTKNLPSYESHMEWYTLDGKTDPNEILPPTPYYEANYEIPMWINPPLASVLSWPLVKIFFNEDSNVNISNSVKIFRVVALMMYWFCILSMFYLVKKRCDSDKVLFYASLPLLGSIPFFVKWTGMNWWYYDVFLYVFLTVALLMRKTKYEKYIYIPLALMTASKLVGFLFLIPFAIENRKLLWCSLAIVPYFIQCWLSTGDLLYVYNIWFIHETITTSVAKDWGLQGIRYISFFINRIWYITVGVKRGILLFMIMIVPFVDLIRNNPMNKKENWFLPVLLLTAVLYGTALEAVYYHMMAIVIVGILVIGTAMAQRYDSQVAIVEYA